MPTLVDRSETLAVEVAALSRGAPESEAVCQYFEADRGVVANGGIGKATVPMRTIPILLQEWRSVRRSWFQKLGGPASRVQKGHMDTTGGVPERNMGSVEGSGCILTTIGRPKN